MAPLETPTSASSRAPIGLTSTLAVLLAAAGTVHAHPPPQASGVAVSDDGRHLAVRLERGIVVSGDAGATWALRCNEAAGFGLSDVPDMVWVDDELLLATASGLSRDAAGCDRRPGWPELDGTAVSALVKEGPKVWLVTSQAGVDNGLWVSEDGGKDWIPSGTELLNTFINELAIADGGRLYAAGVELGVSMEIARFVRHTDDAGETWEGGLVEVTHDEDRIVLLGSVPGAPDVVFVTTKTYESSEDHDRVLRSDDGGRSFEQVYSAEGVTGMAAADGSTLWLSSEEGLATSVDGGLTFEPVPGMDAALGCAVWTGEALLLCGEHFVDHFGLARWEGTEEPVTLMAWTDVTKGVECGDTLCDDGWADWQKEIFPDRADPDPDPTADPAPEADADPGPDVGSGAADGGDPPASSGGGSRDSGCAQSGSRTLSALAALGARR